MEKFKSSGLRYLVADRFADWGKLFLRVIFSGMMLIHGLEKVLSFNMLKWVFPPTLGLSSEWSLAMIILVEVGCSLLVLFGILTRLAVLPLMLAMIIAAFFTYNPITMAVVELPLLYWVGFFLILLVGPGRYSVDYWLVKHHHERQLNR